MVRHAVSIDQDSHNGLPVVIVDGAPFCSGACQDEYNNLRSIVDELGMAFSSPTD